MGLDDLIPDEENSSSSSKKNTSSSKSGKKYTEITQEEFDKHIKHLGYGFERINDKKAQEIVYESRPAIHGNEDVVARVYSSIDKRSGTSRSKGSDAIRTVLFDKSINKVIGGRTRTHRIPTWKGNLRKKVESLMAETEEYVIDCDECGGWLVEREGKNGKFYGCTNYPSCDNTEAIEE